MTATGYTGPDVAIGDVSGLQAELDSKLESPIAISDVTNLQTTLNTKLSSPIAISDTTGLQAALDGKLDDPAAIADVTGLQAALDAKYAKTGGAISGNVDITGTLDVTGGMTITGDLARTGDETVTGDSTVNGNFTVQDAATPTKAYRFRTNGANLDLECGGKELFISDWDNADFTGTQRNYLRLENGASIAHATSRWIFGDSLFAGDGALDVDPSTGVVKAGLKNGLGNIQFCGMKATAGAPGTGTWATGDLIIDSAGAWHLCTAGGTPGTWT